MEKWECGRDLLGCRVVEKLVELWVILEDRQGCCWINLGDFESDFGRFVQEYFLDKILRQMSIFQSVSKKTT